VKTPTGAFKLAKDSRPVKEKTEPAKVNSKKKKKMAEDILEEALQEEMKELYQTAPPRSNTSITEPAAPKRNENQLRNGINFWDLGQAPENDDQLKGTSPNCRSRPRPPN